MIAKIGRMLPLLLTFFGLLSLASTASAQGNTFNPYGNSGYADYREFGNPMVSNNPALPGQAILNSAPAITRQRANSFQQYSNELDGADPDSSAYRRGASTSVPYYQAYQSLNKQYNRVYQPNNNDQDRAFYERQKQREQSYAKAIDDRAKALEERDPAKRAKLLRQAEQDLIDRPTTSRSSTAKSATAPKPGVNGSAPAARSSATTERRTPAPSPYANDNARRSSTTKPAARPPAASGTAPPPTSSRPSNTSRPAPDPSTIPIPAPR